MSFGFNPILDIAQSLKRYVLEIMYSHLQLPPQNMIIWFLSRYIIYYVFLKMKYLFHDGADGNVFT